MTEVPGQSATDTAIDDRQTRPKNVGTKVRRTEDPRLLTGTGTYVDDRHVKGMLHVAFRRSDHPHARIVSVATAAARALPQCLRPGGIGAPDRSAKKYQRDPRRGWPRAFGGGAISQA